MSATQPITVNITDLNEDPELTSGTSGTVVENLPDTTAVYTATATDQDAGHDGNIDFQLLQMQVMIRQGVNRCIYRCRHIE